MWKLNSDLCELIKLYGYLHRLSEDALNVVWQQNMYTAHCILCWWKRMYTLSLLLLFWECQFGNFASIYLSTNFHEASVGLGEPGGISGKICAPSTVNNAETESEILRSCRLKRLRHASIKLKSAKWVFLRDLHRLNCNGFLFLVSPADIMMWPLLLLLLSLFSFYSTSCFLVVSSAS